MAQVLLGLELTEIQALLGAGQPAWRARQIYEAVYRRGARLFGDITVLPSSLRRELDARFRIGMPEPARCFQSADGARRYLLKLDDGRTVEAVLMPEDSRDTICISTQAGCPVGCRFCMTGLMGLERNLTAGEIVGQVLLVSQDNRLAPARRRANVVMMGMGEPLLNLPNVVKAARLLADKGGVGLSERRITLSTAGIIPAMEELGREPVRPRLAVSLNASTEEQRRELMPVTRKYPLKDLLEACRAYPLRPWERLTFEYVLLKGVNDTDADARRVVRLLSSLKSKLNLIALNPGPGIPFESPDPGRVLAFQAIVRRSLPCFIRKPRGRDIFAACGQLKRMAPAT
jgi:23S rRNA (adenine2503-C2)-methyltransferase